MRNVILIDFCVFQDVLDGNWQRTNFAERHGHLRLPRAQGSKFYQNYSVNGLG